MTMPGKHATPRARWVAGMLTAPAFASFIALANLFSTPVVHAGPSSSSCGTLSPSSSPLEC